MLASISPCVGMSRSCRVGFVPGRHDDRLHSCRASGNADRVASGLRAAGDEGDTKMLEYNLTQRERQILVRLLDLSQQSKEQFEARLINPDATGPSRELARLDFG